MTALRPARRMLDATADPNWVLEQRGARDDGRDSPFAISNGFLGVRGGGSIGGLPGKATPAETYVAGLFDIMRADEPVPTLVLASNWLRVGISLSAQASVHDVEDIPSRCRTLDFRRGALITESRPMDSPGFAVRSRTLRLVSLSRREVGLQLVQLDVERGAGEATLEAYFEGVGFGLEVERLEQDLGVWRTRSSGGRLAMAVAASLQVDGKVVVATAAGPCRWAWTWLMQPGQTILFERMVAVTREDAAAANLGVDARRQLGAARVLGSSGVVDEHEAGWARRWRESDVVVGGDTAAQVALRFALYHLNGAANPDDERVSIAARALTGSDYRGHVFWDTEIFLLPFYTLTWPEAARTLLMYRFHTLDAARAKARRLGWRGALYAWESAGTGEERTPEHAIGPVRQAVAILCGVQEQHISADIAYAVWNYWLTTGDDAFLREAGAEIILETARFWSSRAVPEADGRRHIRGVIGPDEYHETIDDNVFTNVMARWNIRRAIAVAAVLRQRWPACWAALSRRIGLEDEELREWAAVADAMATGLDPRTGLFEQFAGFFALETIDLASYEGRTVPMDVELGRERTKTAQVLKQADVVALLALLPDEFAAGAGDANYRYYEPRCSHGSSLSAAMHGLAAARLGRTEAALGFFRQTSAIDLAHTRGAADGGIHIAPLGGLWMMAVLGFAGLTIDDEGIGLDPQMPDEWQSLAFSVQWRGRHVSVSIDGVGLRILATLTSGAPMSVAVGATRHVLRQGAPLHIGIGSRLAPPRADECSKPAA